MIRYWFNDPFVFILIAFAGSETRAYTILEVALYDKRLNPGQS